MLKALVIHGKFPELGDVLKVSRAEAQKAFHTHQNVYVIRIIPLWLPEFNMGVHVAVVSDVKMRSSKVLEKEKEK